MIRRFPVLALLLLVGLQPGVGQDLKKEQIKSDPKKGVFLTPEEGGIEYSLQGEYTGMVDREQWAAQVVAKKDGQFEVYFLSGGLPGAGWDTKTRIKADAKIVGERATFDMAGWKGTLEKSGLNGTREGTSFRFTRVNRASPTALAKPPAGAIVLFDGTSLEGWNNGKVVEEKHLYVGTSLARKYRIGQLHLEFRTPFQPRASGQGRGNSGVYLNGDEIQILDSFGLKGENNECGGFYGRKKPDVNMCLPPLTWQTYDVEFIPSEGKLLATVKHNGVVIHDRVPLRSGVDATVGINLQNHGNPVVFRNIWIVERK